MTAPLATRSSGSKLLVLLPDANDDVAGRAALDLLQAVAEDDTASFEAIAWTGGVLLDDLRALGPVSVVSELSKLAPASLAERALHRVGLPAACHAVRRHRLGLPRWNTSEPDVVCLTSPAAAPLLRFLPDPLRPPVDVLVPAGEMTEDDPRVPLRADDLALVLDRADRFFIQEEESRERLASLGVASSKVVSLRPEELLFDARPERPDEHRLAAWRDRLGIDPSTPIVVGSGPLVWFGGADLFVRTGWILRERLGMDVALCWVDEVSTKRDPTEALELRQLDHDIVHMGLEAHVHLLSPEDAELLWLADVRLLTSREPDGPRPYIPWASMSQAVVGFRTPGLEEFVGDDAGRLVDFLDLAGMARATADLIGDDEGRVSMGRLAGRRFGDRHVASARPAFLLRLICGAP